MRMVIVNYINKVLFRLRWFCWSERERYAYLWNRTQDSLRQTY